MSDLNEALDTHKFVSDNQGTTNHMKGVEKSSV